LKTINIIAFDVPYPANYGGVIDVFYKIKCFHEKGIKIHLHCYEYGRGEQAELNNYCETVTYYKRKTGIGSQISTLPYIVKSRTSSELKNNLLKNDFPILFEGLHCCFLLNDKAFKGRFKIVRNHNIEHNYYDQLAHVEKNIIKRKYFTIEAKKLKEFEPIIENANLCLTVSNSDLNYFQKKYPDNKFIHIPCFHSNNSVQIKSGKGNYVLYHGNLSIPENIHAAKFIIKKIFDNSNISLKIAGLNPPKDLINLIENSPNIELIQNPSDEKMINLITNAQINLLYTNQATGLKLKLLNVLYNGRHCVVNSKMATETSLIDICLIEDNPNQLKKLIKTTFSTKISEKELEKRKAILLRDYSNENGFQKIIQSLQSF